MDQKKYDEKFVKRFTDFPLLVRQDTLVKVRAAEVLVAGRGNLPHRIIPAQRRALSAPTRSPRGVSCDRQPETANHRLGLS
jgi:hypothetical protein